jgi:hypothetical protein
MVAVAAVGGWRWLAGGPCRRVGKNPGFFLNQPSGFFERFFFWGGGDFGFFGFFFKYICPEERVFRVLTVSRILLGASRL